MLKINQQGFTFLEMIIAIFVSSLMATAVAGIYIAFSKLQTRTNAYQALLNDSHFVIELMAREFRAGTIFDYSPEADTDGPGSDTDCAAVLGANIVLDECIMLIREGGQLIAFAVYRSERSMYLITPTCEPGYVNCSWSPAVDSYTVLFSASLNSITIDSLKFKISPTSDPFAEGTAVNRQPMVTMQLKTRYMGQQSIEENVTQTLQTTISARIYNR